RRLARVWRRKAQQFVGSTTNSFKFYRMIFDRAPRHVSVLKWHGVIGELLVIFVTFARDQDDVTRLGDFDGSRNRLRAIGDFLKMVAAKPFFDFGDDLVGIFFARIIGGDDGA